MSTQSTSIKTALQLFTFISGFWLLVAIMNNYFEFNNVINKRILLFISTVLIASSVAFILEPKKWKTSLYMFIIFLVMINVFFIFFGSGIGLMDAASEGESPVLHRDVWIVYDGTLSGLWGINLRYVVMAVVTFVCLGAVTIGVIMLYYGESTGEIMEAIIEMSLSLGFLWFFATQIYPSLIISVVHTIPIVGILRDLNISIVNKPMLVSIIQIF